LIYSTASPFTDHLIALLLVKLSGLPWVADFRDLWVDRPNFPKNRWRLFIDRKLEKMVIQRADHVITATSLMAEHFKRFYPNAKYTSITNGYDEDDFTKPGTLIPDGQEFILTYTGYLIKNKIRKNFSMLFMM
jgi:glycosyltransferase involved in cell wall biosynthesis